MEDLGLDDVPALLTVREFAAALRVHHKTVHRWIEAGTVASIRPGRDYRIPASELRRVLALPPGPDADPEEPDPADAEQVA